MLNDRLAKVKALLKEKNLDAVLLSSTPNIIYLTNFDHFYPLEREGFLLITKKNNYIITDKRYTHAVQTHVKNFILCEIAYMHGFKEWIKKICEENNISKLGVEENNLTIREEKIITPFVKTIKHVDLLDLRMEKSDDEIKKLTQACALADKTFTYLLTHLQSGMTEKEIALLIETFIKTHNAQLSFESIVAIEENGAFVHHKNGQKKLQKNNIILLDFGAQFDNYCSDLSRTILFGKATSEQKKVYQIVHDAQEKAIEFIEQKLNKKQTIKGADVDTVARNYIIDKGYDSFPHGLGHGIGLETHELPALRPPSTSILNSGMAFTIEPGIYLPEKFGVRIEDDFAIANNQLVRLTKSSTKLIEIVTK